MATIDGTFLSDLLKGTSEGDEIRGGSGGDTIIGGAGGDNLRGQFDQDDLFGDSGEDLLQGGDGNDRLTGGNGGDDGFHDVLLGGEGNDVLFFAGEDQYDGGDGFDQFNAVGFLHISANEDGSGPEFLVEVSLGEGVRIDAERGVAVLRGTGAATEDFYIPGVLGPGLGDAEFIQVERYDLTEFGDYFAADNSADLIFGLGGSDIIEGRGGADEIDGGSGSDTVEYGSSPFGVNVDLERGTGLIGDAEGDTYTSIENIRGTASIDALYGTDQANTILGRAGNDFLEGRGGADVLDGGDDEDTVLYTSSTLGVDVDLERTGGQFGGEAQGDILRDIENVTGSDFDDTLTGNDQNNQLVGGGGDDDLRGDGGEDEMYGGADNDTYRVNSAGDEVFESANQGIDAVAVFTLDDYTLTANVENLHLITGTNGTGNALPNLITGNLQDNFINGAGGADTMEGNRGDDTYRVDNVGDVVNESTDQGDDTVLTSISYTLTAGSSLETLATTNDAGTAAINLTGNNIGNAIRGNDGSNILNGRGGADGLDGRGGSDTASYENNSAFVVAFLGVNGAPGFAQEFGVLPNGVVTIFSVDTLVNIENLRGSNFNDTLIGNEAINELRGGGGSDTYVVQNAGDTVIENGGQGNDEVRAAVSYTLTAGADVETLRTTDDNGTAAIDLTGNTSGNNLIGNNGDNTLNGGGGADGFVGRGGNDTYIVDSLSDTITENGGQGIDTVRASVSYTLTAGADVELLATNNDAGTVDIFLTGNANGNEVRGNAGNNIINGGDGRDTLTGLGGFDQFAFNTALDAATNVDEITDFNVGEDSINLDNAVFTGISSNVGFGTLRAEQFVTGTAAQDAQDRIIYDSVTGALFFDADGTGAVAAIQFAEVTPGLALTNLDFLVV
jgi:Ca2+-binding RTX toxin-like protein